MYIQANGLCYSTLLTDSPNESLDAAGEKVTKKIHTGCVTIMKTMKSKELAIDHRVCTDWVAFFFISLCMLQLQ